MHVLSLLQGKVGGAAKMLAYLAALTVLHGGTAHAQSIDPATAEKILGAVQKVIGFLEGEPEGPDIPLLIEQSTTQIINEIRSVRNEGLDARIESILWDHSEWLRNPARPGMDDHLRVFFSASLEAIAHMKRIIDGSDYQSAHHFTGSYNVMLAARASAMKMRPTWFMQEDFDTLFIYWVRGNYRLVGAREISTCLSFPVVSFPPRPAKRICLNTIRSSQAAKSISDYWFTSIEGFPRFYYCECNVTANKCVNVPHDGFGYPAGCYKDKNEAYGTYDFSEILYAEWDRILTYKFLQDPSVQVARGTLQSLMEHGHNEVASNVFITVL